MEGGKHLVEIEAACCRFRSRALKSTSPVLGNSSTANRAVSLTYEQFRYGFANAVSDDEAKKPDETFPRCSPPTPSLPGSSGQSQPWTEAKVDYVAGSAMPRSLGLHAQGDEASVTRVQVAAAHGISDGSG
jgi:hypothetical protein